MNREQDSLQKLLAELHLEIPDYPKPPPKKLPISFAGATSRSGWEAPDWGKTVPKDGFGYWIIAMILAPIILGLLIRAFS